MTERRLVVDARRHRGNSNYLIELVGRFSPGAAVEWLVRPDQAHLVSPESIIGQAESFDKSWTSRLCEHLVQSVSGNGTQNHTPGSGCWVLSYDNYLLAEAHKLNQKGLSVTTKHLSELFQKGIASPSNIVTASSTKSTDPRGPEAQGAISLKEAAEVAKRALLKGGFTSRETAIRQKDLRARMRSLDPRLGPSAPAGLIYELVDLGLQEGWLKRFRQIQFQSGTEFLYLAVAEISKTSSVSLGNSQQALASKQDQSPDELTGHGSSVAPAHPSIKVSERKESEALEETITPRKHPNRATGFEAILSKLRIGSLPETRDLMLDALEAVISTLNGEPILLTELFARATTEAQQKAEKDGFTGEKSWTIAERCIKRLMMWAGVLIAQDGQPVADKIGANASQVRRLAPDFRRLCEAFLAERIISETGGIKYDDDPYYLGLTLYRRGRQKAVSAEELKAKADGILMFLEEAGRIELDHDRVIRIKTVPKKAMVPAKQISDDVKLTGGGVRVAQPN